MLNVAPPLSAAGTNDGRRVVLVDDRQERRLVRLVLDGSGFDLADVSETDNGAAALHVIQAHGADAVLIEIQIQGSLALIASLRARYPEMAIVICSFHTDPATKQLAFDAGADSYLDKPVRTKDLHRAIVGPHARHHPMPADCHHPASLPPAMLIAPSGHAHGEHTDPTGGESGQH